VTVFNTTEENFKDKGNVTGGAVCYRNNNPVPLKTRIEVTCHGFPVGNLIRLHTDTIKLVICDLRVYDGNVSTTFVKLFITCTFKTNIFIVIFQ
jgi:hypothetical protein